MILKRTKFARIVAIVLALILLISLISVALGAITANAAVTQSQIDNLKTQKKELSTKKQEVQSQINSIEYQQMTSLAKKEVLDDQISLTEQEIESATELIATYVILISEKEDEVVEAQRKEDEQLSLYKGRVRNMEEIGLISYLGVIFQADSFSDLLALIDDVGSIMKSDEQSYQRLIDARLETISAKEGLETAKTEQEAERVMLLAKQEELDSQLVESIALITELDKTLETMTELANEMYKQEAKIQAEIVAKEAELKRQQDAAKANNTLVSGSGTLKWPCPSSNRVTSEFGGRFHPVYKVYRQHTGIDIGAGHGTNITSADSVTVITSAYNSSYGNYVVVSHGNGRSTLYAHMSSRKVKEGQTVSKGDLLGLVGSTGASTGPHLHFEVIENGTRVNPLKYFTGYVLAT